MLSKSLLLLIRERDKIYEEFGDTKRQSIKNLPKKRTIINLKYDNDDKSKN